MVGQRNVCSDACSRTEGEARQRGGCCPCGERLGVFPQYKTKLLGDVFHSPLELSKMAMLS